MYKKQDMFFEHMTFLESLLRCALGLLLLNLPWLAGAWLGGRLLRPERGLGRFCAQAAVAWTQAVLSFELLGSLGWLGFWPLCVVQGLALGGWILAARRWKRRGASKVRTSVVGSAGPVRGGLQQAGLAGRPLAEEHKRTATQNAPQSIEDRSESLVESDVGPARGEERAAERAIRADTASVLASLRASSTREETWDELGPLEADGGFRGASRRSVPIQDPNAGPIATGNAGTSAVQGDVLPEDTRPEVGAPKGGHGLAPGGWLVLLVMGFCLVAWGRQILDPPAVNDALSYHLPFVAEWLSTGAVRMPRLLGIGVDAIYYPIGAQVLMAWTFLSTGTEQLAKNVAILALPLMLAALIDTARMLQYERRTATLAWALFAGSSMAVWLCSTGHNELWIVASLFLALRAAVALWLEPTLARAIECGLCLGLAVGNDYAAVPHGAGVALLAFLAVPRGGRLRKSVGLGLLLIGFGLLSGGFVYLRNFWLTGSPLYPSHVDILGLRLFTGRYSASEWVDSAFFRLDWKARVLSEEGLSSIGLPILAGLIPLGLLGAFWVLRSRSAPRILAAWSGWLGLILFAASSPFRSEPRWWLPGVSLLAAACLPVLDGAARRWGERLDFRVRRGRWVLGTIGLVGFLGMVSLQPEYLKGRAERWERLLGDRGRIWNKLGAMSPAEGLTIAIAGDRVQSYPLYGANLRNRVVLVPRNQNLDAFVFGFGHPFLPVFEPADPEQWVRNLRQLQVDVVFTGPGSRLERSWIEARPRMFVPQALEGPWRIYAFRAEAAGPASAEAPSSR